MASKNKMFQSGAILHEVINGAFRSTDMQEVQSKIYFMAEPRKEIPAGLDLRAVIADLVISGMIVDQGGKPNKVFHVPGAGRKHRLYEVDHDKLDGGADDQ